MHDDPEFGKRISKKVEEIKVDKAHLAALADDYGKKYQEEILEGTELRNKMLTEGSQKGLNEEQVLTGYGKFLPSVYTPLLNLLYFMLRESEGDQYYGRGLYKNRDAINEELLGTNQLETDNEPLKTENIKDTPKMEEYLYGNLTLENFDLIKKLKRLSLSANQNEAFLAYRKANDLCKKYQIDFNRIPV